MSATKGSRPFARLKMSNDIPFIENIATAVSFNTVDLISDSFGELIVAPTLPVHLIFAAKYGIYSVQLQVVVSTIPTSITAALTSTSASAFDSSSIKTVSGFNSLSFSLNANRKTGEVIFPGNPAAFPTAIFGAIIVNGGGNGNIVASGTQMLIEQLTTY